MSAGDARHGRRDNGLVAAEYAAAGDVDPRVGEHLLDVLALDGIAAYLRPSTDLHPVTRSSTLPGRPTDRLYVDRTHLATARDYLDRLAEEPDGSVSAVGEARPAHIRGARIDEAPEDGPNVDPTTIDAAGHDSTGADGPAFDATGFAGTEFGRPGPGKPGLGKPGSDKPGFDNPGFDNAAAETPGTNAASIDAEWARIVAAFDTEVDLPARSWPAAEDLPEDHRTPLFSDRDPTGEPTGGRTGDRAGDRGGDRVGDRGDRGTQRPRDRVPDRPADPPREDLSLLDGLDTFGMNLPEPEEDGYEPPTPPPVPRPSAPTALAVAGIILGLIVFLKPALLSVVGESVAMLAGFTAVVGGFATLVWRLRPGDDDDIDPDDGARV